jgi:hypothetical protein
MSAELTEIEEKEATSVIERMTRINQRMVKLRTREAQVRDYPAITFLRGILIYSTRLALLTSST